jgi:hypothetical protein
MITAEESKAFIKNITVEKKGNVINKHLISNSIEK